MDFQILEVNLQITRSVCTVENKAFDASDRVETRVVGRELMSRANGGRPPTSINRSKKPTAHRTL